MDAQKTSIHAVFLFFSVRKKRNLLHSCAVLQTSKSRQKVGSNIEQPIEPHLLRPGHPFLAIIQKENGRTPFFVLELSPFQEGKRKKPCLSEAGFLFYCDAKYVHADF